MLDKTFDPKAAEPRLYAEWEDAGTFQPKDDPNAETFSIVIPPPNVTGSLHIGHALNNTLQDVLVRYNRMLGKAVLWQPGTDHAGIATQMVVERQLAASGNISRRDMGREEFIKRVWEWKEESGGTILNQLRRLGASCDWSRERFTMDDGLSKAVLKVFVALYKEGLIYRDKRLVNWDPHFQTAISDLEVENKEVDGHFWRFRYPLADGATYKFPVAFDDDGKPTEWEERDYVVVATTRPETVLGDTGVAVHPDDERYAGLVGKKLRLPIANVEIPIVADEHADPEQGSGAVKITPAHDFNDFMVGERQGLPMVNLFDREARLISEITDDKVDGLDRIPQEWRGLDRFEAREKLVERMDALGLLDGIEDRKVQQPFGDRSGVVVEPFLTDQWFVKADVLAKDAIAAVEDGRTKFHPKNWENTYFNWMRNIQPWCISRQLWWGHRIPAWYDEDGNVYVAEREEDAIAQAGGNPLVQDEDVLDTWFSSALWPFSTLGWPDQTDDLRTFYPTSVLVTGYDILFFWVARMMMFGLYAMEGRQPFDVVALHGMVRDQFGKKMSKSYGNVVDPLDWIDRFGADATRFTLVRGANPGADVPISEEWCQGSRNFCNKLWNATRFALLNGAHLTGDLPDPADLGMTDRWIMSRLQEVTAQVDQQFEAFELAKACDTLYHFAWDDVCDWYLELSKPVLGAGGGAADRTRRVLGHVLDQLLRLLHPVTPFVTDELWSALAGSGQPVAGSLMVASWPVADPAWHDPAAEAELAVVQRVVTEVRRFRSDQGLRPTQRVSARLTGLADAGVGGHEPLIRSLTRLDEPAVEFSATAKLAVTAQVGVEFDTRGSIDVAAERARLTKDRSAAKREAEQCRAKLGNSAFVDKAPAPVVDKIRTRLTAAEAELARIAGALAALPAADGEQP